MKGEYPTMMDFLILLSEHKQWNSEWRQYDRIYFIQSSIGHDGLYEMTNTVWFDAMQTNKAET